MTEPLFRRIQQTRERFEKQWQSGDPPDLRKIVDRWEGDERQDLYRNLLELDIPYRHRNQLSLQLSDYDRAFPEFAEITRQVFEEGVFKTIVADSQSETPIEGGVGTGKYFGRYRVIQTLGQGGMGAVYLAHDDRLDREVAIKVPFINHADAQMVVDRFFREARALAAIVHPNICPIHEVNQEGGVPFMVMTYVQGKPLTDPEVRPKSIAEAVLLIKKLAYALHHSHQVGVVHRDLKPSNVIVNYLNEPVIIDFGLATLARPDAIDLTTPGAVLGTPAYMSPEQVEGTAAAIGPKTDIYTLGVILYELLAGSRPFSGKLVEVLNQILTVIPPKPSDHRNQIDAELDAICMKAIAKSTESRYSRMVEFADRLEAWLQDDARFRYESDTARHTPRERTMREGEHGTGTHRGVPRTKTERLSDRHFESVVGGNDRTVAVHVPVSSGIMDREPAVEVESFPDNFGYRLIERIGEGQYGEVWRAMAPGDVEVAVKKVSFPIKHKATQTELKALSIVKRLRHPLLLNVQAFWVVGDQLMIVSELADESLEDTLRKHKKIGIERDELLHYMKEAAEAIDFLHSERIFHRDIKPANILLQREHVKVADFGIAITGELQPGELTVPANVLGTPLYMAPEAFRKQFGPRSDQFSLAATYLELRLGRELQSSEQQQDFLKELPAEEQPVIGKALSQDPAERFETCTQFIDGILDAIRHREREEARRRWLRRSFIAASVFVVTGTPAALALRTMNLKSIAFDAIPQGFEIASDAQLVRVGGTMLYSAIERPIDEATRLRFQLIPRTANQDLASFYCMQDLVSNAMFARFVQQSPSAAIGEEWKTGTLAGNDFLPAEDHPHLPVVNVSAEEAYLFANAIGCDLPTKQQWDKAAGRWDHPPEQTGPFEAPADEPVPDVAVDRIEQGPAPIGSSRDDVSVFGCRDMAGNVKEWTKTTDDLEVTVPIQNQEDQFGIVYCGNDYRDSAPLTFEAMESPQYWYEIIGRRPPFGFRCVVEIATTGGE
ncbi:Serine/threonine-protein kinase PrkC [Rosistilla carotiformis]|uniref:Serine/threonine-protein kinase PrkC n=1 Tax=Rosistilla carotiformis TaxID=2528017 RepID=A0A518JLL4_9BACT|nr:bifunctional serine/threonine-protein kinase/formylglycine-generating enzyme family protein [Rosistilla carotiformis]QDV66441.1 Serine/threonine-protein kinase PrkC [Rosistilla carotiformis]